MSETSFLAPREGDLVIFCEHADVCEDHIDISPEACKDQPFHWYYVPGDDGPNVARISVKGRVNKVIHWIARCHACYTRSPEAPKTFIGREARWIGAPPHIR
jgi:hypothetical protein